MFNIMSNSLWNDGYLVNSSYIFFQTPYDRAQSAKSKGNKYFKGQEYEKAIKCYTDAIELCPPDKHADISTYYQNRAAAHEQLVSVKMR